MIFLNKASWRMLGSFFRSWWMVIVGFDFWNLWIVWTRRRCTPTIPSNWCLFCWISNFNSNDLCFSVLSLSRLCSLYKIVASLDNQPCNLDQSTFFFTNTSLGITTLQGTNMFPTSQQFWVDDFSFPVWWDMLVWFPGGYPWINDIPNLKRNVLVK